MLLPSNISKMFEMEGCEIEFREDALSAVARKVYGKEDRCSWITLNHGKYVMLDTMYDLPSMDNISPKWLSMKAVINSESRAAYDL